MGDFGDFKELDSSLGSNLYFLILVCVTVAVVIVMLNLLIAIISDSFEKVMALDKNASIYEKLQLIIELNRRNSTAITQNTYLCVLKNSVQDEEDEINEERIRNKLNQFKKSMELFQTQTTSELKEIRGDIRLLLQNLRKDQALKVEN